MAYKTKPTVSANPLEVQFPFDQYQSTQELRAVGLRAAGRVGTDRGKLKLYLETLDVLKGHAVERFKKSQDIHRESVEAAKARAEAEAKLNEDRVAAQRKMLQEQLDALTPAEDEDATEGAA